MIKAFFQLSLIVIFTINSLSIYSQNLGFEKMAPQNLMSDLDSLNITLQNTHQNLFTYCTQEDYNLAFEKAKNSIVDSLNSFEFATIVSSFLKTIKDSHSYLNYNSLKHNYNRNKGRTIELFFHSINDSLFIFNDKLNFIEPGSKLLSINGIPSADLFLEMNKYSNYEGNSYNSNQTVTEHLFSSALGYVMEIKEFNTLELEIKDSTYSVKYPSTIHNFKARKRKNKKPFDLEINTTLPEAAAKLKITSFSAGKSRQYTRFLKKSFRQIKKQNVEHLIIDLRNNGGGRVNRTDLLMSFIKKNASYIPNNIIVKQSNLTQKKFRKKTTKFNYFILEHFYKNNEVAINFLKQLKLPLGETDTLYFKENNHSQKSKYFYDGKQTYLLINGLSASASVLFASAYRNEIENGIILGTPCMGPATGTWGNPTPYRLPNSELDILISTIRTNVNTFETDPKEFSPDVLIEKTVNDYLNEEDPVKIYIEELIKKRVVKNVDSKKIKN